ncbi:MAG: ATP-binding cassette domain-containing protein [Bacteroidales bacterium]|jgi:ABC-type multidrug transport system ATPase subunit|nr:ATP-binding cassette domain-containing protein [Bacteroidales bacterium]
MSKPIISIKNLSFANVFNNFSLSIPAGVNFAIAGENGIGKTTLMKILCGLLPTYKGIITFFNGKHHTD